ncbi:sporulation protein [Marinobacter fuscus]|uniref:Sporulation protein n=1 Tax=Marinobacter fuscus TaxID=2109942 RepID=A0A2T1K3W6_9GAMM|nr:SPOR domain-containing protein [Marinobacter fuscus]PSF04787.1 sporulation protein [Marinobacter fuscus]
MDGLKQRIIGALVLVSLAVIFVPMIFDEPHSRRESTAITIPEEPPFPEVDLPDQSGEPIATPPVATEPSETERAGSGYRIIEEPAEEPQNRAEEPEKAIVSEPEAAKPEEAVKRVLVGDAEIADKAEFSGSLAGAWVVQLGSFGNADNAQRLRDKVLEMGYGAHLQQVSRGDTSLTRVFSGPFVNKDDAARAKAELDKAFGLNSLVTTGDK